MQSAQLQGDLLARAPDAPSSKSPPSENRRPADAQRESRPAGRRQCPDSAAGPGRTSTRGRTGSSTSRGRRSCRAPFLDEERARLIDAGILGELAQTCSGNTPLAMRGGGRRRRPGGADLDHADQHAVRLLGAGHQLSVRKPISAPRSASPTTTPRRCGPAGMIYLIMALLVTAIFVGIWRNLRSFGTLARQMGYDQDKKGSFAARTTMPELRSVAEDFDRLIEALRNSAQIMRRAAEDNAPRLQDADRRDPPIDRTAQAHRRASSDLPRGDAPLYMIEQSLVPARQPGALLPSTLDKIRRSTWSNRRPGPIDPVAHRRAVWSTPSPIRCPTCGPKAGRPDLLNRRVLRSRHGEGICWKRCWRT